MSGIEDYLLQEGYFYFVVSHRHRDDLVEEYPRLLQERAVEGLIRWNTGVPARHADSGGRRFRDMARSCSKRGYSSTRSSRCRWLNHEIKISLLQKVVLDSGHHQCRISLADLGHNDANREATLCPKGARHKLGR